MATTGEGLRERRRRQTRDEIHSAALRLVREHGFDKITVDMISAEAGVSPRTFFNYFPNKEAAVLSAPPAALSQPLAEEFAAQHDTRSRAVLADLTRLLVRELAANPPQREEMHAVFALTQSRPALLAELLARFDAFQRSIAEAVGQRIGQPPEGEVPTLIAAVALTAVRTGLEQWTRGESAGDREGSAVPYVERSAEFLRTLLTQ